MNWRCSPAAFVVWQNCAFCSGSEVHGAIALVCMLPSAGLLAFAAASSAPCQSCRSRMLVRSAWDLLPGASSFETVPA